jgi:hypothetical protein
LKSFLKVDKEWRLQHLLDWHQPLQLRRLLQELRRLQELKH